MFDMRAGEAESGTLTFFPTFERITSSAVVSHISRKTSEIPRISCTWHSTRPRVRLSLRKGAYSWPNPLTSQEIGDRGTPRFVEGRKIGATSPIQQLVPFYPVMYSTRT